MVELIGNERKNRVLARDLRDGQIAIIIENGDYNGRIVQRFNNIMVAIGLTYGNHWEDIGRNTLEVRILEDGELIRIKDNK
jgi:hypothetical protein